MSDERDRLATNDPVLAILTDLIEELYGYADSGVDSGWAPLYSVIDRAEARLREVSGHHLRTTTGVHTVNDNWPIRCHFCPDVWSAYPDIGWCDHCDPDADCGCPDCTDPA